MENIQSEETHHSSVIVSQSNTQRIIGDNVTIKQCVIQSAEANQMEFRQGCVLSAKTNNISTSASTIGLVQTQSAELSASKSVAVVAGASINMGQSGSQILVAGGDVTMDQSGAVLMVANTVNTSQSGIVFLFAKNVTGEVHPVFGSREAYIFGVAAGVVAGAIVLLGWLARRKRK